VAVASMPLLDETRQRVLYQSAVLGYQRRKHPQKPPTNRRTV
jgi:hypothetical protein